MFVFTDLDLWSYWWSMSEGFTACDMQSVYGLIICGVITGDPCWQVLLYMPYKGSPDTDLLSYWWSMLAGFNVHGICRVPRHNSVVLLVVHVNRFNCTCYINVTG